jgi:hypothetical protein
MGNKYLSTLRAFITTKGHGYCSASQTEVILSLFQSFHASTNQLLKNEWQQKCPKHLAGHSYSLSLSESFLWYHTRKPTQKVLWRAYHARAFGL